MKLHISNLFHRQDAKTPRKTCSFLERFKNSFYLASLRLCGKRGFEITFKNVFLGGSIAVLFLFFVLALPARAGDDPKPKTGSDQGWTYKKFKKAFKKSGRTTHLTASEFDRVQERKEAYLKDIQRYLTRKFGWADPHVMKAFQELPREYFHYNYQDEVDFSKTAYEYPPRTWALGWGSALSDYEGQAYMAQLAHPTSKETVLEVGTGSGFNISLLSRMVKDAYSIEIIHPLGQAVSHIFKPLDLKNVHTRVGDGYYGWKDVKGGFDIIMFTCVAQFVPPPLFNQLKHGGRIIIPIGQPFKHNQVLYVYRMDKRGRVHSKKYIPVYFIPMKGTMGIAAAQMGITVPGLKKKDSRIKAKKDPVTAPLQRPNLRPVP